MFKAGRVGLSTDMVDENGRPRPDVWKDALDMGVVKHSGTATIARSGNAEIANIPTGDIDDVMILIRPNGGNVDIRVATSTEGVTVSAESGQTKAIEVKRWGGMLVCVQTGTATSDVGAFMVTAFNNSTAIVTVSYIILERK